MVSIYLDNCSAWPRLKLNTKMGLNHPTTPHHTTPPGPFRPLLDKLGSYNFAQTLIWPTRLRNRTHFYPNPPHLTLYLGEGLTNIYYFAHTHFGKIIVRIFWCLYIQSWTYYDHVFAFYDSYIMTEKLNTYRFFFWMYPIWGNVILLSFFFVKHINLLFYIVSEI